MPGMMGTEFLARVADLDPKTIRILVTAFGDSETLESAINSGSIYRFVPKPWNSDEMRLTIRRGIEVYALDREREQLVRELTLLNQVSKTISQELNFETLLKLLVETITEDFGFDAAALLICDQRTQELTLREFSSAGVEVDSALQSIIISERDAPLLFDSLVRGQASVFRAGDSWELDKPVRKWITEIAAEETLIIPLRGRNGIEGAIAVDNRRGRSAFSSEDQTLLEGLANQAVTAVENARLVEDLRKSRQQIMQSDRLGTLGTLAAGLAHEINNPLVSIRTFISMAPAKRYESDEEFWNEYHSLAFDEVERIRRLVETMQRLGRDIGSGEARELLDLDAVSRQVVTLVQREAAGKRISVERVVSVGARKLFGVRDQIHQLILNLLLNALHAAQIGGQVFLRVYEAEKGDRLVIEIEDDGPGVSDEDLERVFDPFFTTKGPDEGTGLGLMICHRIVTDHNGMIEVENASAGGAVFRASFPFERSRI
jgi:signal transduction histidine kinase